MDDLKSRMISRRNILLAAASAAPLLAISASPVRAGALPPTAVAYQATPKDGKQCDGCNLFVAPNACKSVSGEIAPSGWCKLWVKKA